MIALIDSYSSISPAVSSSADQSLAKNLVSVHPIVSSVIMSYYYDNGLNRRVVRLLDEFMQLHDDWDEEGAVKPSPTSVSFARSVSTILEKRGQPIYHAAPGPNGEIMLDIRKNDGAKSLELIFYPTKSVAVKFSNGEKPSQEVFNLAVLPNLIKWLNS